ncbi:MAG: Glutamyl-tRNA(Gln) amidotransferase subunit A [Pseudomonas sp.]|nr:MAG: Glutamyl-tRNA(Gln) amidotransferase subunit A [Pseudomonas sp.]
MIGFAHGVTSALYQAACTAFGYGLPAPSTPLPPDIEYAGVQALNEHMARPGGLTSQALVSYLQQRIKQIDQNGPALHSVIELNPQALEIARERDRERASGKIRGPLHGIPVLLKDNIETGDTLQTSAGAFGLVGAPACRDAFIVERLREQGAVILGKTNLSELAGFRGGDRPAGWSSRGGQTLNPHRPGADVGGSSSGASAALAAGLAPLAVGTETNGSIVVPAALNGIVGLKPSVGLLSREGIIPASHRQDTPGPMARSVFDTALLLNAMAGRDPHDTASIGAPQGVDYTAGLVPGALQGKRIGYPALFIQDGTEVTVENSPQFTRTLELLKTQGAVLVPVTVRIADASRFDDLLLGDVKQELNNYLATRQGLPAKSIAQLIAFNEQRDGEGDHQPVLKAINDASLSQEERDAQWGTFIEDFRGTVDEAVSEHSLDALVSDYETNSYFAVAAAGYPGISVPSGIDENALPTSAYFYGPRWSEATLLAVAYGYEQASRAIRKPGFRPLE